MKKNNIKSFFKGFIPYLIILSLSVLATFLFFYKGVPTGDDFKFHFGNILDQYNTLKSGNQLSGISTYLADGIGMGTRMFYSPLAHFIIARMLIINEAFGIGVIETYKIFVFLTVFISGIFIYKMAMHMTNMNMIAALLASAMYILFPYRLFDIYRRMALAEILSFVFIPLFFMGLYDITHQKEKLDITSFVEVIIGGALLYLSHNLTAFYTYIAGIIYLLFNIKGIIKGVKINKLYLPCCIISACLLLGIASLYIIPQIELIRSDFYNLTDRERMWTDIAAVTKSCKDIFDGSGFINITRFIAYFPDVYTEVELVMGLIMLPCGCIIAVIIDQVLKELKHFKYVHSLISAIVLFAIIYATTTRKEIYYAALAFVLLYNYVIYTYKNYDETNEFKGLFTNENFYYCVLMLIVTMIVMSKEKVWEVLPSLFLNIQFVWRLWAFVQFFLSMLIAVLAYKIKAKQVMASICCIIIVLSYASSGMVLDRRIKLENNDATVIYEIDENLFNYSSTFGWNREYCPKVFYDDDYKSEYNSKLFNEVKKRITYSYYSEGRKYLNPEVLKGDATYKINSDATPNYNMDVAVNNECIIQMPLIYYEGYEFTIMNIETNESYTIAPTCIDGLVSFTLDQGNYHVTSTYKGTKGMIASRIVCVFSSSLTIIAYIYSLFTKKRKNIKNN